MEEIINNWEMCIACWNTSNKEWDTFCSECWFEIEYEDEY